MSKQTELPFIISKDDIAGREAVRKIATARLESIYMIPLDCITIRNAFNWRRKAEAMNEEEWEAELDIPELAEGIHESNGPHDPLVGDILKNGKFYINEGERRYRALRHLIATGRKLYPNGLPVDNVQVFLNPKEFTDIDRKVKIFTSQNKKNLKPMEIAYGYLGMKEQNGKTHEQISKLFNISRQKVDNYILATELPEEVQMGIDNGTVKLTNAIAAHRAEKKTTSEILHIESAAVIAPRNENIESFEKEFVPNGFNTTDNLGSVKYGTQPEEDAEEVKNENIEVTEEEKAVLYETNRANEEEMESRRTDPNFKDKRPKSERTDALGKVDFKRRLSEGEMDIEQAVKYLDKLEIQVGHLPAQQKQAKNDMEGLIGFVKRLLTSGLDKIKRASSPGTEE